MTEIQTLARPYADAVFELAQANDAFDQWSNALAALAAIVANDDMAALMHNPEIADATLVDTILGVAGADMHGGGENLVRLLVENNRLALAGAIADQFEARRAAVENRVDVGVVSAAAFSDSQRQALSKALETHLARNVQLSFEHDEDIIGGAVIRAGDLVIDGSVRAQLERMRLALSD